MTIIRGIFSAGFFFYGVILLLGVFLFIYTGGVYICIELTRSAVIGLGSLLTSYFIDLDS